MLFSGFIFDVEGTLIDCIPQNLQSLQETLAEFGVPVPYEVLQLYSGMDGDDALRIIAPSLDEVARKKLMKAQGERYQKKYLETVRAFAGVRRLFEGIKSAGGKISLATDCQGAQLRHYHSLLSADDLIDQIACGDDVEKGKPDPGLVRLAVKKLSVAPNKAAMVGDTPYDAEAAKAVGVPALGLLSGGFTRAALLEAGCFEVAQEVGALGLILDGATAL
ncbi:HAD family hydrolase [Bradyrhizobium sp.]|uniref:HAD family hydrolase n=1 Tax=Bradyrhizobium sp. TaxID=376 RepID=UPI003C7757EA